MSVEEEMNGYKAMYSQLHACSLNRAIRLLRLFKSLKAFDARKDKSTNAP